MCATFKVASFTVIHSDNENMNISTQACNEIQRYYKTSYVDCYMSFLLPFKKIHLVRSTSKKGADQKLLFVILLVDQGTY